MAESVERRLEQFVPAFEQLQQLGVYNQDEVRSIISKLREHENNLTSRNVRPEKFLKYIQFAASLLELTEERKAKVGIDPMKQRLLSDVDIPKHIHTIYRRLVGTFPDDTEMWGLYFDYCETRHDLRALHSAFDECLQRHRNKPQIWIRAARWEMLSNNNPELARKYMLSAAEANKKVPEVYSTLAETICYLTNQIIERSEVQDMVLDSDASKAPLKVYEEALKMCEDRQKVFELFYEVFTNYKIPVEPLIEQTEQRNDPKLFAAIALKSDDVDAAFNKYIESNDSTDLKILYADYIGTQKRGDDLVKILDQIEGFSDEEATRFCELLLKCGKYEDAKDMLYDGDSNERLMKCRLQVMSFEIKDNETFIKKAKEYIKDKDKAKKELYSLMAFLIAKRKPSFEQWFELISSIATSLETDDLAKMMKFTLVHFSAKEADKLLEKLTSVVVPSPAFIEVATEIAAQNDGAEDRIRHMHEVACQKWGRFNANVWLNYVEFEVSKRNFKKLESIRRRAVHTLEDSADFQRAYSEKFCNGKK